jgi:hypothetical protein
MDRQTGRSDRGRRNQVVFELPDHRLVRMWVIRGSVVIDGPADVVILRGELVKPSEREESDR